MPTRAPENLVFRYLDTVGDGTGTKNAIGDYSVTSQIFKYEAQITTRLSTFMVWILDTNMLREQDYGNESVLTNGWNVSVHDVAEAKVLDITDNLSVMTNGDLARESGSNPIINPWGAGSTHSLMALLPLIRSGSPLALNTGWSLRVELSDNFTGLLEHYFKIEGFECPSP